MADQVITIPAGNITTDDAAQKQWRLDNADAVLVTAPFLDPGVTTRYFRRFIVRNDQGATAQLRIGLADDIAASPTDTGQDLLPAWELAAEALVVTQSGVSVAVSGPDNVGNAARDASELYRWSPDQTTQDAVAAFFFTTLDTALDLTLTLRDPNAPVIDAGDIGWTFDLLEPRVSILRAHLIDAGDLSWSFGLPEPQVSIVRTHVVDAGDAVWSFDLAQPQVTKTGLHIVDAGDLSWSFDLAAPQVTITSTHRADAGDVAWSFALAEPQVTIQKSAQAGDIGWTFDLLEPRANLARGYTVDAADIAFSFGVAEPMVTKTTAYVVNAASAAWSFDLAEPLVTRVGPVSAAAGGIEWQVALLGPRVTHHERLIRTSRGARRRMTHRAFTERPVPTGTQDPFGNAVTRDTQILVSHPCYWQAQVERVVHDSSKNVSIADHLILFPLGTDVQERDRITSITDRRGRPLKNTRLGVLPVLRREDHIEVEAAEIE